MENYVTYQVFFWIVGAGSTIFGITLGYWIKEIKGTQKSMDAHKQADEKEFYEHQRHNDLAHSELRQLIHSKTDGLYKDISNIAVKLDFIAEFVKEIKDSK